MAEIEDGVLAGAHSCWRSVNLTALLRELDAAGLAIVDNQKTSLQERRRLAERTKEFRAVPDARKLDEFKPLLRAYQGEIDALTTRMKQAENGFLRLFKALSEAPDPEPFLAALGDTRRTQRAQREQADAENARLRARVAQLEADARQHHAQQPAQPHTQCEQHDELIAQLKTRESDLQRQLAAATRRLAAAQASLDAEAPGQRSGRAAEDRRLAGAQAELEILQSDYDRAAAQAADLQAQNAKLRADLAALAAEPGAETLAESRRRVRELDDETRRLFASLEDAESRLDRQAAQAAAGAGALEEQVRARDGELQRLRDELRRCADYDEIRRDLDIMKSVEFAVSDWGLGDTDADAGADSGADSLERLLVRRNKALENRLVDAQNRLQQSDAAAAELSARAERLDAELRQKAALAERLEADLLRIDGQHAPDASQAAEPGAEPPQQLPSGLLEIVTGQRDRFRQRNIELEDELREHAAAAAQAARRTEQLTQDNLRLYEETKYLRSYTASASAPASQPPSKFSSSTHAVDMDAVGAKYKRMYEESLNPFNAFHRRETSRRVRAMGIFDRLVYMVSSVVAGSRRARIAVLAYVALLHLMVLLTLYRSMLDDSSPYERVADTQRL
ncbi:hypothetical protein IWW55_003483 [Coemansia sp. RSA 2706]|nr:hypothetical protein IWW55_003483 [Coemansia sp. RSA 2706]